VSGWLADAAERKLRADSLHAYTDEVEAASGPPTDRDLADARRAVRVTDAPGPQARSHRRTDCAAW
jgi:hypothetical protein